MNLDPRSGRQRPKDLCIANARRCGILQLESIRADNVLGSLKPKDLVRHVSAVEAVIVRSGQEPVVVNLDIPSPEDTPVTPQPDPFHSAPGKS